ncbi:MAG TPA: N-6 DNA methylase [Edaphocola sp.]|nr:N-6 DNA methylase [Edaphocola sp.]
MTLSWNEIKDRALKFSKEWADTSNEEADAKPFLVEFFNVFGISSKRVSTFEHRVKKLDDKDGYIDLLWKGTILIEMKSRGKNLDKAFEQAKDYLHGLKEHELPKYILISDFENFRLHDLEEKKTIEFKLNDLVNNVQHFGYLLGYQKKVYKEQDPANIKAAELMGKLHDRLEEIGYTGHPLEVYLVRLLFCLFAEDTTIFEKQQFQEYIEQRTNIDGSDLAAKLQELFQVLNTPKDKRFKNLDEQLADFPYVNGKLFEENLPTASFDSKMRQALLDCTYIDWSKISPAIFGSMFQSVMNPKERRNLGAHYTSETNILKLIKPLFLDELWKEFENIKDNKNKLGEFHRKISTYKFLDPACGCGNFLIITYRELRLLELEVLRALNKSGQRVIDVSSIILIDVDQFYGIEYEEFPARIAEVAMWLIDHQMNMLISNEFGQYFVRLPLKKAAQIHHADALETDWENVVSKNELSFIIGNPPFIGSKIMKQNQRDQIVKQFDNVEGSGVLDYVSGWYIKAAKYILNTKIKVAFVSTNSIVQGEQTSILWEPMISKYNVKIHFAHRTFKWSNE